MEERWGHARIGCGLDVGHDGLGEAFDIVGLSLLANTREGFGDDREAVPRVDRQHSLAGHFGRAHWRA